MEMESVRTRGAAGNGKWKMVMQGKVLLLSGKVANQLGQLHKRERVSRVTVEAKKCLPLQAHCGQANGISNE